MPSAPIRSMSGSLMLLSLLACSAVAQAQTRVIACPNSLRIQTSVDAPSGWIAFNAQQEPLLDHVGFFEGAPSEGASLVPDNQQTTQRESRDTWNFVPERNRAVWAACFYRGTSYALVQSLDRSITSCFARYSVMRSGQRLDVIDIQCTSERAH